MRVLDDVQCSKLIQKLGLKKNKISYLNKNIAGMKNQDKRLSNFSTILLIWIIQEDRL